MTRALPLLLLSACGATLSVTRTRPPALGANTSIAVAASGPYALELVSGVRARVGGRAKVESCVLGCPAVGLYASLALTPGPHEGRVTRSCQAEVYTGDSWAAPAARRGALSLSVDELEGCVDAVAKLLLEPQTVTERVPLDARGPLAGPVDALRAGRFDEARMALEAQPTLAGAWYDLAVLHEAQGRPDDAARCYREARSRAPDPWLAERLQAAP
ncbi:MAG: tetratricopeptide repeat protein [Myxococcales bacterium]|nr:tetratricopeptide repeat protein [Myxococcales bacterium]